MFWRNRPYQPTPIFELKPEPKQKPMISTFEVELRGDTIFRMKEPFDGSNCWRPGPQGQVAWCASATTGSTLMT